MNRGEEEQSFLEKLHSDRAVRTAITRQSHYWFFNFFLSHYVQYATADFQREMFTLTEDEAIKLAVIVAFRGSAKSTILTLSYALWAILGIQQKKFVLILSKTQHQVKVHFTNLKKELESNALLRADLGPFEARDDEWGSYTIVLPQYGARITAASSEQSIRGLRHGEFRPQLVLADDIEDLQSVHTLEGRDKTHQWFTGEVVPIGDKHTRIIVVGNLLHDDSLLKRLSDGIENGMLNGVHKFYPLLDANDTIAWPGKYPNRDAVEAARKNVGDEAAWQREYLLKIITSDDQVIRPEWIQYYDALPTYEGEVRYVVTGVDLAISEKESADYTAMVSIKVYGSRDSLKVFVLPNIVNERLDFPATVERAIALSVELGKGHPTKLVIEEIGYQKALIDHLRSLGHPAVGFKPQGQDKRERLSLVSHLIQQGKVLFPREGARVLIQQLLGFGKERHDDAADALVIALLYVMGSEGNRVVMALPTPPGDQPKLPDYRHDPKGAEREEMVEEAKRFTAEMHRFIAWNRWH